MMAAKYSLETSHFCLFLSLFMMKFILSSAVCSGLRQLENGRTFFRYGGIYATFTCNPGFRLLGHVRNSCIKGKWRKPVPVCVASGCQLPTGIVHGSLHTSHKDAAITFSCKEGYKLFGSAFIYCNGRRWNSTIPVCRVEGLLSLKATSNRPPVSISTFGPPKYITGSENLTYNTDFSRHGNSERKQGANIQPIINLLPVTLQEQITVSSITKADMNATANLESITTKRPKPNATQGTDVTSQLNKTKHRTIHLTTTPALTPLARTPMITKANSNEIQHYSLKTFRRRMWCFYPPVPNHGTFRFLTLENPLPNQYPYYIQYYCYPGYTMTRGDVYSFCLESGAWSGVIPTCEGS